MLALTLTVHSILLANLRLAPIQIASLGHSASTWGADIDYFLSGVEAELPVNPDRQLGGSHRNNARVCGASAVKDAPTLVNVPAIIFSLPLYVVFLLCSRVSLLNWSGC